MCKSGVEWPIGIGPPTSMESLRRSYQYGYSELPYIYIPRSCSSSPFAAHLPYITLAPQLRSQAANGVP